MLFLDNSVVVSGPTGSGKTAIFELAVVRLLIQYENLDVSQNIKIVYSKFLCIVQYSFYIFCLHINLFLVFIGRLIVGIQ